MLLKIRTHRARYHQMHDQQQHIQLIQQLRCAGSRSLPQAE